ncbi:YheT family hydrolase [Fusobacterium sp. PH5-44]|uniref:YheT family hydrolase n=1 Tax=unclassified Fusobacterium TaxID=2648384 RepID=UPI003D1AE509
MDYKPSFLFKFAHINTCFPTLFRKIKVHFTRERLITPDDDFIDIDWLKNHSNKVIVLCHGLEGSSSSKYIQATAKYFVEHGWDALAMNFRSCSGELNKKPSFYHSGYTSDLELVLEKAKDYKEVVIVGYSLGANLILKYLGERDNYPKNLLCGIAVSPPCDLYANSIKLNKSNNFIYRTFFTRKLKKKAIKKAKFYPDLFDKSKINRIKKITEFDDLVTAPLFGYKDSTDYYIQNSSKQFIPNIKIKTLILTPLDDPIMAPECYPYNEAKKNSNILLETPKYGAHIGFSQFNNYPYFLEKRLYEYVESIEKSK